MIKKWPSAELDVPAIIDTDVVDRLRDRILAGAFSPDRPLRIDALALHFGVSHMPVREALRRLETEGLVSLTPRRGARVIDVTPRFVADLLDVRTLVESFMTRRAVERITPEALRALEAIESRYEGAAARSDVADALHANRDFHRAINRIADNHDGAPIRRQWRVYGYEPDRFAGVIADHRQMLTAFAARDVDGAGALAAAHSTRAKQTLLHRMEIQRVARARAAA